MPRPEVESPEAFLRWVEDAEPDALVQGLVALTDADRRRLAKEVAAAWRKAHPDRFTQHQWELDLALMAVCSWTEARRFRLGEARWAWQWKEEMRGGLFAVLDARRPEWLERWVERELQSDDRMADWDLVRQLVRSGACPVPKGDDYIVQMIRSRAGLGFGHERLVDVLRRDPGLFENEIWRIFEIDPPGQLLFQSDEAVWTKDQPNWMSWGEALVELAASGEIDRGRLLASALGTLRRGLQIKDFPFYVRLLERLEPAPQELEGQADALLDLVSHSVDAVARYGVDRLATLLDAGRLAPERAVERAPAALPRKTKSLPIATLRLLRLAVARAPSLWRDAASAALEGLSHPSPEVQGMALELLDEIIPGEEAELGGQLAERIERLAPSQRERALALHRRLVPGAPAADTARGPEPLEQERLDPEDLVAAARALPARARALAGVDRILEAMERGDPPPLIEPDAASLPRLADDRRVTPLPSLDATIDGLAALLEGGEDPLAVELALDGLSRFAGERPGDLAERTAALLQRASQPAAGGGMPGLVSLGFSVLICRWLAGAAPGLVLSPRPGEPSYAAFFQARLNEVAERIDARVSAETLALPTHEGGWIDPRELVARVGRFQNAGLVVPVDDLIQALLRLAPDPDRRQEAARAAGDLGGDAGRLVRFALGGEERPPEDGDSSLWQRLMGAATAHRPASPEIPISAWIAAARARSPFGEVPELRGSSLEAEPWGVRPPAFLWSVEQVKRPWSTACDPQFQLTLDPPGGKQPSQQHPLRLLAEERFAYSIADVRLRSFVWPIDPKPLLAAGCHAICLRLFRPSSNWTPTAAYLEPLLDPATPLSELANVALAMALVAQDADARQMAIEVVVSAMRDGRSDGRALGAVMGRLALTDGVVKLGRVAKAVDDLVRHGPAQQLGCAALLEDVLAAFAEPPRDMLQLLVPYHELLVAAGRLLDSRLAPLLQKATGSGKTASIARELLALQPQADRLASVRRAACAAVLRTRVDFGGAIASRLAS